MAVLLFKDPRDYIKFEYELRKARSSAYSMRAFARDLKVSPSSLIDFMKGRIGMSQDRVEKIAFYLKWPHPQKEHFSDLIFSKYSKDKSVKQAALIRVRKRLKDGSLGISVDAFRTISDWYHLVILEIFNIKGNIGVHDLAVDLNLPVETVQKAIKRLIGLGLLVKDPKRAGNFRPLENVSHFGDEAPSTAIIEFHLQMLDLAQKALKNLPMEERSSQSLIFSIKKEKLKAMNHEIRKAIMIILNRYMEMGESDSVCAMSLQSFPIWTKPG